MENPFINNPHMLHLDDHEIQLLVDTSNAITSQLKLDVVLKLVTQHTKALINAKTVLLPILNKDCTEYTYAAGCGENTEEIIGESLPVNFGVCGWVWKHKAPWWTGVLDDMNEQDREVWRKDAETIIMIPLIGKRRLLGGLTGMHKEGGGKFDERDLSILTIFASQVAIAIENAMAVEELEEAQKLSEQYLKNLKASNFKLEEANRELKQLALYDHLTGIPNRFLLLDRLEQNLRQATRSNEHLAVLMIDLNKFKEVNDNLGHETGDQLLKQVSTRLQKAIRNSDTIGRLGGDEFAVVSHNVDKESAQDVANALLMALEPAFEIENHHLFLDASIGIAIYPDHGSEVSTLLKCADIAMYSAKQNKDGYFTYCPDANQAQHSRHSLMSDLRDAIQEDQLELYYQPKLDLHSGKITGVEALSRWNHPVHGFIPPNDFIPIIEQTRLIQSFTSWALNKSMEQYTLWYQQGVDLTVSVNLSVQNLRDPNLSNEIHDLLKKWKIPAKQLILEITESALMDEQRIIMDNLKQLEQLNIQLSIDDYGTGYSSLSHLKKLTAYELKIDRSFVEYIHDSKKDHVIIQSTIELAHSLDMLVTAEGIEDIKTLNTLMDMGCDMAQGYYIDRPMPASEIPQSINKKTI
ncbi:MAG: bifunctional diguanylate cyclase/phosphodiesterase [Gammaproteobacteria bacterium]|nr:bifunctional diguanylate cyclase/phosphodiesterase [Gammaproteobacteria bacterium]